MFSLVKLALDQPLVGQPGEDVGWGQAEPWIGVGHEKQPLHHRWTQMNTDKDVYGGASVEAASRRAVIFFSTVWM